MCFSASASFTASALLLLCSIAAFKRAQPQQYMIAAIPLFFSIQQFFEGLVWQGLYQGKQTMFAIYAFLFFVFFVWPLWIPFAIRQLILKKSEKKILALPILAGALAAIIALNYLTTSHISARILDHHIQYIITIPTWLWTSGTIVYLLATITPFFIAKINYLRLIGITLVISYGISFFFFHPVSLSVWCFFAAIFSILVLLGIG